MEHLKIPITAFKTGLNSHFASKEPWQIVTITTGTVLISVWLYNFIFDDDESIITRVKKTFFRLARNIPAVKRKLDAELEKVATTFRNDVRERTKNLTYITTLPRQGLMKENIFAKVEENLTLGHYSWKKGYVSGSVYYDSDKLIDLVKEVYGKASYTNPLHPDVFPGICKMEAEVIRMAVDLFHGDTDACGTMTSGGTESILMACRAFRDYAKETYGIKKPEIIVPVTVHSAFDKAAQYLGLRVRTIPVDITTYQVNIDAMKHAINSNTVLLVGSAPNFPYGTMDDITAISELGIKYNIPVHVDSCLGGFLTAFMSDAGYPVPLCDFRLPGVMSISADTHKYGYAPKGTSVILYRDFKYRHHQYTVTTDWPGGAYGSPTVSGSRAGGNIAVCWATMLNFGYEGYVQATREVVHTTKYIEKQLRKMSGIFIFGQPVTSVVAIGSNVFHIYRLADALSKNGWNLNALQYPPGIHICVTHVHTQPGVADKFLSDVQNALNEILKSPDDPIEGRLALYGAAQSIPDRSIVGEFTRYFIDALFYTPLDDKTKIDSETSK